jgi:phosphoglucomutase
MELDITAIIEDIDPCYYSASCAELGVNAGQITWSNALDKVEETNILSTDKQRQACRAYFREFGAWSQEKIQSWSNQELDALLLQYISENLREAELYGGIDTKAYAEAVEQGRCSGNIFKGTDDNYYIYLGI